MKKRVGRLACGGLYAVSALLGGCAVPGEKDKANLAGGFADYTQRRYEPAERAAGNYIQKFPGDAHVDEALYLRGLARQGRGDAAGASEDLAAAITKSQRKDLRAKANRALGDIHFDARRWDPAIACYSASIIDAAPRVDPYVYERLGASLQSLGKWDEARPYFQKVIEAHADAALTQRAIVRKAARSFELQFGAFTDVVNARGEAAKLKAAGIPATPISEMRDAKLWWLVRAGSFRTHAEAEAARQRHLAKHPMVIVVP